jgi:tetratricopeptide (TPR) repeat protein
MTKKYLLVLIAAVSLIAFISSHSNAQYGSGAVTLPYESQKASITQTVGLTNIEIVYHRPAVKQRKIWGGLVPFNNGKPFPWRGGANENTVISFSTDVEVEGKPLTAGTYGLHFIPAADTWTIIFSKNSTSWGSFSYNEAEDALRIIVTPKKEDEIEEYLTYEFENPQPNSVSVELVWEKLSVPFTVTVDLEKTVIPHIKQELRNSAGFSWVGYNSAAMYCSQHKIALDQGLKWAERSVGAEARFENLETQSRLLKQLGRTTESDSVMKAALEKSTPLNIYSYGRDLLEDGNTQDAMDIFQLNMKRNPDAWYSFAGLARGNEALGKIDEAIDYMKKAISKAPDNIKRGLNSALDGWLTKYGKQK